MRFEIIQTENYLLVVSDEEIKDGDYSLYKNGVIVRYHVKINTDNLKKIIAHRPLNGTPYLDGVAVLPEMIHEAIPLAKESIENDGTTSFLSQRLGFVKGYKKAKEKYKYTDKQLVELCSILISNPFEKSGKTVQELVDYYTNKLNQPKLPVAFECEMESREVGNHLGGVSIQYSGYPETEINSEGRTEWVGKYEF